MGQCTFINCNKYTPLVSDGDNEEGYACVGATDTLIIYAPSSQWCCEPKTALKTVFFKKLLVLDGPRARRHYEGVASKEQFRGEDVTDP